MTSKRDDTKPFAADTIQIAPFPNNEADKVWTADNEPPDVEEGLVPDEDKKGRTKWFR